MEIDIDNDVVKDIIKKIAKKHNRSYDDTKEMIMWQFRFLSEKIRETDLEKGDLFHIVLTGFGSFNVKKSIRYGKYKKNNTKDFSAGRSK